MVFLPECCDYVGENKQNAFDLSEPVDGPMVTRYKELAHKLSLWISLGGIHEKVIVMKATSFCCN